MKYLDALKEWLSSPNGKTMKNVIERQNIPISQISPSALPSQYDNVKFDGAYVRRGKFAHTVGEYKDMYK